MDIEDLRIDETLDKESANFICFLIKNMNINNILEIGTGVGYSSIMFSRFCKNIVTIEMDKEKADAAKNNFSKFNVKNVRLIEGNALEEIPSLKERFDLVFIDGMKRQYLDYLMLVMDKLNENFLIISDNTISHKEKVKDYLEYVNKNFRTVRLNIGKGLSLSFKQ